MWGWNLRLRDLPAVNYAESDSEDDLNLPANAFNSPLTSPRQPVHTREGSPQLLAHPPLRDNVDEELEEVAYKLGDIEQVEEEIEELTDLLEETNIKLGSDPLGDNKEIGEEVEETGFIAETSQRDNLQPPDDGNSESSDQGEGEDANMVVNFDVEDKADGEKASDQARSIKIEFDASDIRFWFAQLEDEMEMASVGRQWLKKTVLQRNLPIRQKEDVKALLTLQKADAGDDIYHRIKTELIRIYAPKPQDSYRKALERTMTGLPSQLGYQIVNDVCKKTSKLVGCCCSGAVLAIWSMKLPVSVLAHISNREFTSDTYKEVFEAADKVFMSSKQVSGAATVAAVDLDETQSAFSTQNQPQVAAFRGGGSNRRGRGGRNRNQGRGGGQGGQASAQTPKPRKRHESNPPDSCCDRHYSHGAGAWFCLKPLTCPWVSKITPRP